MCSDRLKNGLTIEQVRKAKELFKRINLKSICASAGVEPSSIYNILRDRDSRLNLLARVVEEANNELKRRETVADSLPL